MRNFIGYFIGYFIAFILVISCGISALYGLFHGVFPLVATGVFNVAPFFFLLPIIILFALVAMFSK